jgi:hypothetical protein
MVNLPTQRAKTSQRLATANVLQLYPSAIVLIKKGPGRYCPAESLKKQQSGRCIGVGSTDVQQKND